MATISHLHLHFLLLLLLILTTNELALSQLSVNYYAKSCPSVEAIVKQVVTQKHLQSSITAPATLRLFFHDCFVQGCDGSVLITSTPQNKAEREAVPNLSLAGDAFDTIIKAKQAVEEKCPGIVSCADILAIAARDAVVLLHGPTWAVKKGRRDGRVSLASKANENLPGSNMNLEQLITSFASKGLDLMDLVVLSGAHTVGHAHCEHFKNRLYNFKPGEPMDPSLNKTLAKQLDQTCPKEGGNPNVMAQFDDTPFTFDNVYYKDLLEGKGLLFSDEALFTGDRGTRALVRKMGKRSSIFFRNFEISMDKLGSIDVLTHNQGEIRKDCTKFN